MHFAYPPRKSSTPAPYLPRSSRIPGLRRNRLKLIAILGLAFVAVLYLISRPSSRHHAAPARHTPSGRPTAVIVTVFDETHYKSPYLNLIRENRRQYAEKHGYGVFFPKVGEYDLHGSPFSWTKVVAMRHALTLFPDATYFWFLDQDAYIMNPDLKVEDDLMKASKVEAAMIKDYPIVPPDSIIKTFAHLRGQDVDFLLTQDNDGLSIGSFVIRNGEWARFLFETWFDPIYRNYNFQKAETHALEHIVQWHPTILSKLALVPQRSLNAYSTSEHGAAYEPGDFAVRFAGCARMDITLKCEAEAQRFTKQWQDSFGGSSSSSS